MTQEGTECDIRLSEPDFVAARSLSMRPRPWLRTVGIVMAVLYGMILCLALIQSLRTGEAWHVTLILWALALVLAWHFLVGVKRYSRKLFRQRKGVLDSHCRLTEDALEMTNDQGHGSLRYDRLTKWRENEDLILVYPSDDLFFILPKRCFDPRGLVHLRQRLTEHLGKAT